MFYASLQKVSILCENLLPHEELFKNSGQMYSGVTGNKYSCKFGHPGVTRRETPVTIYQYYLVTDPVK